MSSPLPTFFRPHTFKFQIITTEPNETFALPLNTGTCNFIVDWGDGNSNTITIYTDPNTTHSYISAGTYIISMTGTCTRFSFHNTGDKLKIKKLLDVVDMGFIDLNFEGCTELTTICVLGNLASLTTAEYMFFQCMALTSIPTGMFNGCTGITSFLDTFDLCINLTSIPADLFKYNTVADNFYGTFETCNQLASIPTGLFRYNTLVTRFDRVFYGCAKLQLHDTIFWGTGERDTRFLNQSVNFTNCFNRTTFSGVQGTAPDLWNCNFGSGTPTKTSCFSGDGNSLTSLDNYNSIPVAWGGPLE